MISRRAFIRSLAVGFIAAPLTAEAQQSVTIPRIGWLSIDVSAASGERYLGRFRRGLTDLGYVEGKNIVIDFRSADGKAERLPALADELVRSGVQVIVALEPPSMQAAARVTRTIPIVARFSEDPVDAHLVASFARPGGHLTGVTSTSVELYGKRLELLKGTVPTMSSIGVILDPQGPGTPVM